MADHISFLMMVAFAIFLYDQKVISTLQRQGKYDPDTHETLMKRIFSVVLFFLPKMQKKQSLTGLTPPGDLSQYHYDSTVCLDKKGNKTRLSYFADENQNRWYKIEEVDDRGNAIQAPRYEPAAVKFDDMKLQFV